MIKKINSLLFTLMFLTLIFALDSCMKGPNFQKPEDVPTLGSFRYDSLKTAQTDSLLNVKWWELFDDPVLDTLIAMGLNENKDVLIATSRIQQSRAAVGIAKADHYPSFGYNVGFQGANIINGVPTSGGEAGVLFTGFGTLTWELDFWGKFRRTTEAARAELLASEYGLRTVQIGLISQISGTYFLLLDYKWRLEISRNTLRLRQESLEIIEARYEMGIIPEIDVNQAQIQRAIAATAIPIFERKVAQTENALSILLGHSPGIIELGKELSNQKLPPEIPVGLPSELLSRRPDILQIQELAHAQTARVGIAEAMRFPAISLTGLLGLASTDLSALTANGAAWSVSAGVLGPIFNFSKNKKRVEVERLKTEQVLHEYDRTVLTAFREVEDALIEIKTLKMEMVARLSHVEAALHALYLSKERYDKGVTSFLELLESQRQAFEAELKLSEVTQQLFNGYIKLYKSLGGGWISKEEMNLANEPEQVVE